MVKMEMYEEGMSGYHFVITSGPTREFLDPVRYLSNPSSGKMGYHIAMEALKYSPHLHYIHGPIDQHYIPLLGNIYSIQSTLDMLAKLQQVLRSLDKQKIILIMAAAPADYRAQERNPHKIKKSDEHFTIQVVRNPDILEEINKEFGDKKTLWRVGFAAESQNIYDFGQKKLQEKNLDLIVINDISRQNIGFQSDSNEVDIIRRDGERIHIPRTHKETVAQKLLTQAKVLTRVHEAGPN